MKVTLEFDLPDEQDDLTSALDGGGYCSAMWEIYNELRNKWKYQDEPQAAEVWEMISGILKDHGIELFS